VQWVIRSPRDRLLDPSCGDGRFIAAHPFSVGVEQNPEAVASAVARAPSALVHDGDFFAWASETKERFECAAGNPPFIRYQTFKGEVRERAQRLCARLGANFSGLASSWAPFLVAAASLLKPGGRMAFVVPAEIGHAPYSAPLLEYLLERFARVQVLAIREKLFPELSEDCWLLLADGAGRRTDAIELSVLDRFAPSSEPPRATLSIPADEWRTIWKRRIRPFLMPKGARDLYREIAGHPETRRLGEIATVGIGYVSGANDFFHLRPSEADRFRIPDALLHPAIRSARTLPRRAVTKNVVDSWRRADEPILLLRLPKDIELPSSVQRYVDTERGQAARLAYKCRNRKPWWSVPDVQVPDMFLTYMSGVSPSLVRNAAGCTCSNAVHSVRLKRWDVSPNTLAQLFDTSVVQLSCEIEGHPLGGGMLKLEPGEATQILLPLTQSILGAHCQIMADATAEMRRWRHYEDLPLQ
jgi:adenine-specific DNA methylase